jgi:N-acetylmuramoyl-L-alanine amidase
MPYKILTHLLTPSVFTRTQKPLNDIKGIIIHYIASPMGRAEAVRNNWDRLKDQKPTKGKKFKYASAHEIIDLDGSILITIPENEIAYHTGSPTYPAEAIKKFGKYPNMCTYGIECTHVDASGKMSDATYNTLVERCADLCKEWKLNPMTDIWLHKEVVGWKICHKWFVENPKEWDSFKRNVSAKMNPVVKKPVPPKPVAKAPEKVLFKVRITTTINLNVRAGAGENFEIRNVYHPKDTAEVLEIKSGWYRTVKGWIKGAYTQKI